MRNFVFTLNNYHERDIPILLADPRFTYIVFGIEVGAEGTPHLQGYGELRKPTRFDTVRRFYAWHIEWRNGTQEQAIAYCKKDGMFQESGLPRNQGDRGDLDKARRDALDGGMRRVTQYGNAQQIRVAEKYLMYNEEPRGGRATVYWYWGKSGTGKTERAYREVNLDDLYVKNTDTKWFDGYDGQEDVILDDFRDNWMSFTTLMALLNSREVRTEYKGGTRQFKAINIWITCPFHPEVLYPEDREEMWQLIRRIDHIVHFVADVAEVGGVIVVPPEDVNLGI